MATVVLGHQLGLPKNKNANRSSFEHLVKFADTSNGAFRLMQLISKTCKLAGDILKNMGHSLAGYFKTLSSKVKTASLWMILPYLPRATKNIYKPLLSCSDPAEGILKSEKRTVAKRVRDVSDGLAAWGYAGSLVLSSSSLGNAAKVPDTVASVVDSGLAAQDFSKAREYQGEVLKIGKGSEALAKRLGDTEKEALLSLAKSVISAVAGALSIAVFAAKGIAVAASVSFALGFTGLLFTLAAHFYKETREYELVDFAKAPKGPAMLY